MKAPEIFYTNTKLLAETKANFQRAVDRLTKAVTLWQEITPFTIESIEALKEISQDPESYYLNLVEKKQGSSEERLKKILGEMANVEEMVKTVYLPKGFQQVVSVMEAIKKTRWDLFTIQDGKIDFSQEWHDSQLKKCYFVCETDTQRKRLEYARKLVKQINESQKLLSLDIEERGKHPSSFSRNFSSKDYYGPMPTGLRLGITNRREGDEFIKEIEPDPHWVINGYVARIPALQTGSPRYEFKSRDYRLCHVINSTGGWDRTLFFEGDAVPVDPMRSAKTRLEPNVYHIIDGKMINTGRKGKRYNLPKIIDEE